MGVSVLNYLRNTWYVAAWNEDVPPGKLFARVILEEPIVFFRDESGIIKAIADRCPHRFAPLARGKLDQGIIECAYHGLRFDGFGRCVHYPHGGGKIPSAATVKSYPVTERHGAVWIWMGDTASAEAALIPDYAFLETTPATARFRGYLPTEANYQLVVDNIMDLSHVDHLHAGTLGGGAISRTKINVTELNDGRLHVKWMSPNEVPPPVFGAHLPNPTANADVWTEVVWSAPGNMLLHTGASPVGRPMEEGVDTHNLHLVTPRDEMHTHYFFAATRSFNVMDAGFNAFTAGLIQNIFVTEDKWMLEAQQKCMGTADLLSLKPVLLPGDAGAMRARRMLQQKMHAEQMAVTSPAS
jgi:phenylpropionate dioxygenase-like ring-hydroxylating dioxygenase large terminal subunit